MEGCLSPRCADTHHGLMAPNPSRQPGDGIIDRYLPGVSSAERTEAREELRAFAASLFAVADRLAREGKSVVPMPDSRVSEARGRIQPTPPPLP